MNLQELVNLPGFWLGAAVFLWSQFGKFSELSADAQTLDGMLSPLLPQFKPRDLTSGTTFGLALFAFLVLSIFVYVLLCLLPLGVLTGLFKLAGAQPAAVDSSTYPLFIATALVGVTQPIPGFNKFASFQASVFHRWIGVPSQVVGMAANFTSQILARCDIDDPGDQRRSDRLSREISRLLDDGWIDRTRPFADTGFYRNQLRALKLDRTEEIAAVLSGSMREKRLVLQELVLAACVSAVRANGGRVLKLLAAELAVEMPNEGPTKKSATMGGLIIIGFCALLLVSILPSDIVKNWVTGVAGSVGFWPPSPYSAAQYVIANFLPIPICAAIFIMAVDFGRIEDRETIPVFDILFNFSRLLFMLFLIVVVYDYVQAFYDRGVFTSSYDGNVLEFMASRLLTFAIHSAGIVICCFVLIVFVVRGNLGANTRRTVRQFAILAVIAAVASYLVVIVRVQYQFVGTVKPGIEFTMLVLGLNVASAIITFVIVIQASRRIADADPSGPGRPGGPGKPKAVAAEDANLGMAI